MLDFIYNSLAAIGFTHPLHPVATHIPMGMVLGGFLFRIASYKWESLERTAFHCIVLALIFIPPTAILGIMDWQHRLLGRLDPLITAKLALAAVLLVLTALTVYFYEKKPGGRTVISALYALSFFTTVAMGFIGGQIVFG